MIETAVEMIVNDTSDIAGQCKASDDEGDDGKEAETIVVDASDVTEVCNAAEPATSDSKPAREKTAACQSACGLMASGFSDGSIDLSNPDEDRPPRTFTGHESRIEALAFSLDGQSLASRSADNQVVVWDVRTGERNHKSRQFAVVRYGREGPLHGVLGPYEEIGMIVVRNGDYATVHTIE